MSKAYIAVDDGILELKMKINADKEELPNLPL